MYGRFLFLFTNRLHRKGTKKYKIQHLKQKKRIVTYSSLTSRLLHNVVIPPVHVVDKIHKISVPFFVCGARTYII